MRNTIIKLWFLIALTTIGRTYQQANIQAHFQSNDLNGDGWLTREQNIAFLQQEDKLNGIEDNEQYYLDIGELMFEHYDTDHNGKLDLKEYMSFAKDIVDETDPNFEEEYGPRSNQEL